MNVSNLTGAGTVFVFFGGKGNFDYQVNGEIKEDKTVTNVNILSK